MRRVFFSILAAAASAACSEKPPRADPEGVPAYNVENGSSPTAERTRNQGESERMGH
jgi:hypothetical protein